MVIDAIGVGENEPNADLVVLERQLDEALDRSTLVLDPQVLADRVCHIQRLRNKLDALAATTTADADSAGVPAHTKKRTVAQHVAATTNSIAASVRQDERFGFWFRNFPAFEAAAKAGHLSTAHIKVLRRADNARSRPHLLEAQSYLAEAAEHCSFADFVTALEEFLKGADPDGDEPRDEFEKTFLKITENRDGTVDVDGHLDPLTAQAFTTAITHEEKKIRKRLAKSGTTRTAGQRRAGALIALIARGFARADGSFPRPLVNIVVSQNVAEGILAKLAGEADAYPTIDNSDDDRRCSLIDGTPLHPHTAAMALLLGKFRRHVFDLAGRPIDVSHDSRSFPRWMVEVVAIRQRGKCIVEGCDAPFDWIVGDHIEPHSHEGPTALWNCQGMCGGDNGAKADKMPEPEVSNPIAPKVRPRSASSS